MSDSPFHAEPLTRDAVDAALALVLLARPEITPGRWRRFARRMLTRAPRRAGLVMVRDARGYIHAMFAYRVEERLGPGRCLCVSDLMAASFPGAGAAAAALGHARLLASRLGCDALALEDRARHVPPAQTGPGRPRGTWPP